MSLSEQDVASQLASVLQSEWTLNCCSAAASTLVLYYHLSTLVDEVDLMHGNKFSSVTVLFYLNRWSIIAWAAINLTTTFNPLAELPSCVGAYLFNNVVNELLSFVRAVFSATRVYAISGRNWWLSASVFLLSMVSFGTNAYADFAAAWYEIDTFPIFGTLCDTGYTFQDAVQTEFAIATGICSIAADAIVLFVIWSTMRSVRSGATNRDVTTSPLIVMLLRNGTVYFILLLSFNILNIVGITCYTFVNAAVFITPISSILISHFLLSLRRYARKPPHPASFPSRLSTVVWDFVSDMGQELGYENRSHDYEIAWRCDDEAIIDRCEAPTSELTHDIEKVPMTTLRNTVGLSQLDD